MEDKWGVNSCWWAFDLWNVTLSVNQLFFSNLTDIWSVWVLEFFHTLVIDGLCVLVFSVIRLVAATFYCFIASSGSNAKHLTGQRGFCVAYDLPSILASTPFVLYGWFSDGSKSERTIDFEPSENQSTYVSVCMDFWNGSVFEILHVAVSRFFTHLHVTRSVLFFIVGVFVYACYIYHGYYTRHSWLDCSIR